MTFRSRKLLDLCHEAPCCLHLAVPCGTDKSVPCHSDNLRHGRGVGHKSHDHLAVPGCHNCHAVFTREYLGRGGYDEVWAKAHEEFQLWLWTENKIRVAS